MSRNSPGHLFIVHGRLEALSCDAVIVPTDPQFSVGDQWRPVCCLEPDDPFPRPRNWGVGAALPLPGWDKPARPRPWFVDVVSVRGAAAMGYVAAQAISRMVEDSDGALSSSREVAKRQKPIIALPVIGTKGAGHGQDRGVVIRALLESLTDVARRLHVDIVIVASSRSDYSALHAFRRRDVWDRALGPSQLAAARELGNKAANGELALFLGAGVSMGAGLPSWKELLADLRSHSGVQAALQDVDDARFAQLGPLEQAELIEVALHRQARDNDGATSLTTLVADLLTDRQVQPSLSHAQLAGLQVREALTTNYDQLYEAAVVAASPSTGQDPTRPGSISVLPWERVRGGSPWIVKMHGDLSRPGSIVLSRSSFVGYDARWRPVASLVQSLMMTRHLLVVGASFTDDNVLRLAYEVAGLRRLLAEEIGTGYVPAPMGTVLQLGDDSAFRMLWRDRFDVVNVEGSSTAEQARSLAIFLDAVAAHAESSAAYLLDERYQLPADEQVAAAQLRTGASAARRLKGRDGWRALSAELDRFGANAEIGIVSIESMYHRAKHGRWEKLLPTWHTDRHLGQVCAHYVSHTSGYTFLHQAAYTGHEDACRELIRLGASLTAETHRGMTPAEVAEERGHARIARLLRDAQTPRPWGAPADPGLLPSSNRWTEAVRQLAETSLGVAYDNGNVAIPEGATYYADSFGRVLIGPNASWSPPRDESGRPLVSEGA